MAADGPPIPVEVTLTADKKITGEATGTWAVTEGTSYMNLVIGGKSYRGVLVEQTLEPKNDKTIAFTGLYSKTGETVWAYQTEPDLSGIEDVTVMNNESYTMNPAIYDLQGRRVAPSDMKQGIYIVNGRKVVVNNR